MKIKELADKVGFPKNNKVWGKELQAFAELVENAARKDEREECAKVCDEVYESRGDADECATEIRGRSKL